MDHAHSPHMPPPRIRMMILVVIAFSAFCWGLITVLNDILVPHLKHAFSLTYFQASLIQFCFFGTYLVISPFVGLLLQRVGPKYTWIMSCLLIATGCILFVPASQILSYPLFLFALFILASGAASGGVSIGPIIYAIVKKGKEAQVYTIVNTLNSLGTTIGPFFGAFFILSDAALAGLSAIEEAKSVQTPYMILACIGLLLMLCVFFTKVPNVIELARDKVDATCEKKSLKECRHWILGMIAIFFYVGAEVSIGTNLVSMMQDTLGFNHETGAKYIALYWGGAMVGRFIGIFLLEKISPQNLLSFAAIVAAALCLLATCMGTDGGWITVGALLSIGLFNSIMFSCIKGLSIQNLGILITQASGLGPIFIVGGAIIPPIQGLVADHFSLLSSFIVPALCYFYILFFGLRGYKVY